MRKLIHNQLHIFLHILVIVIQGCSEVGISSFIKLLETYKTFRVDLAIWG